MSEDADKKTEMFRGVPIVPVDTNTYELDVLKNRLNDAIANAVSLSTDFAKVVKRLAEAEKHIDWLEKTIANHKQSIEMIMEVSLNDGRRIKALEQRNGETR